MIALASWSMDSVHPNRDVCTKAVSTSVLNGTQVLMARADISGKLTQI